MLGWTEMGINSHMYGEIFWIRKDWQILNLGDKEKCYGWCEGYRLM